MSIIGGVTFGHGFGMSRSGPRWQHAIRAGRFHGGIVEREHSGHSHRAPSHPPRELGGGEITWRVLSNGGVVMSLAGYQQVVPLNDLRRVLAAADKTVAGNPAGHEHEEEA